MSEISDAFAAELEEEYGDAKVSRQELDGELVDGIEDALFTVYLGVDHVIERENGTTVDILAIRERPGMEPDVVVRVHQPDGKSYVTKGVLSQFLDGGQ